MTLAVSSKYYNKQKDLRFKIEELRLQIYNQKSKIRNR
jgi:hypothetical protein